MSTSVWKASPEIYELLSIVKSKHHSPRLDGASVAICMDESKVFVKNKLNLGKLSKFSPLARLYQKDKYDFCLTIPLELWQSVLQGPQKEAYLDLQLTRCDMEYVPEIVEDNGKKKKVTDEWGRMAFTSEPKYDADGNIKWKIDPLDLEVFAKNVSRYGLWQDDLFKLHEAMAAAASKK